MTFPTTLPTRARGSLGETKTNRRRNFAPGSAMDATEHNESMDTLVAICRVLGTGWDLEGDDLITRLAALEVGGGGNIWVWSPTNPSPSGRVYATFFDLWADASASTGPIVVWLDPTHSSTFTLPDTISAGVITADELSFVGPLSSVGDPQVVELDGDVAFDADRVVLQNVTILHTSATSPAFAAGSRIECYGASGLVGSGDYPMVVTDADELPVFVELHGESRIDNAGTTAPTCDPGGNGLDGIRIRCYDHATVSHYALGCTSGGDITVEINTAAAGAIDRSQPLYTSGTLTFTSNVEVAAEDVSYDDAATSPAFGVTTAQAALDFLKSGFYALVAGALSITSKLDPNDGSYKNAIHTVSTSSATVNGEADTVCVAYSAGTCTLTLQDPSVHPVGKAILVQKSNAGSSKITITADGSSSINGGSLGGSIDVPYSTTPSSTTTADIVCRVIRISATEWRMS